mgnify:CR=1 FL=1
MFNDPKYKNLVNDISGILSENIKKHFEEILPENMSDQVILAAEEIEEISEGARTAEAIGKIMKDNFYAAVREAHIQPTNEMSAEFYRRVIAELKMPKTNEYGEYTSTKVRQAARAGSERARKAGEEADSAASAQYLSRGVTDTGNKLGRKARRAAARRARSPRGRGRRS